MKILHICSGKGLGGTRSVFLSHQKLFESLGLESIPVVRPNAQVLNVLDDKSRKISKTINYYRRFPIHFQKSFSNMQNLANSCDLIWVHKPIDCYIWRKVAPKSKIVMVVHGFQNTNLTKADYLIAVSIPVFNHLKSKGFNNVFLINNFLKTPITTHNIKWNEIAQISSFGFFRKKKGFIDLIDALDILENKLNFKNFKFDLYGNGRLGFLLRLKKFFQNVKNLKINPWTNQMQKKLLQSDIVVIPSRSESFSMVTIEAMAAGCLVISTKCFGPEFIITDGIDGILIEKRNPQIMAEKLKEVIENKIQFTKLREKGRKMVFQKFSIESSKIEMKKLLDIILEK